MAENLLSGQSVSSAVRNAGYSPGSNPPTVANNPNVQTIVVEARAELARTVAIKKSHVINGILGAIDRAHILGEPRTEIAGWSEISKIMGFHAPEVKRIELTTDQNRMRKKFEQLSDQELLEIAEGQVIEGEFSVDE